MEYTARTTIEKGNIKLSPGQRVPDDFLTEEEISLFVGEGVIEPGYYEEVEVHEVTSHDSAETGETRE